MLVQFFRNDSAQGLLEYALIIALVSIIAVAALTRFGLVSRNSLQGAANNLS